ncbi:hypothetical protein L195_g041903, partial [Trifolium pratense]
VEDLRKNRGDEDGGRILPETESGEQFMSSSFSDLVKS